MRYLLILLIIFSCSPAKKAHKYVAEHPEDFAKDCATFFPVKDSVIVIDSVSFDTLYVPNDEWWKLDTVFVKGDTIRISKNCPPTKVITRTIRHDSLIIRENTARVKELEKTVSDGNKVVLTLNERIDNIIKEKNEWKGKAHKRFWLLILIIGLVAGWVFRKPIGTLLKIV